MCCVLLNDVMMGLFYMIFVCVVIYSRLLLLKLMNSNFVCGLCCRLLSVLKNWLLLKLGVVSVCVLLMCMKFGILL